jgi:hypothetical protein
MDPAITVPKVLCGGLREEGSYNDETGVLGWESVRWIPCSSFVSSKLPVSDPVPEFRFQNRPEPSSVVQLNDREEIDATPIVARSFGRHVSPCDVVQNDIRQRRFISDRRPNNLEEGQNLGRPLLPRACSQEVSEGLCYLRL